MDVAISVFRAELARWIEQARAGEEIVVTDRGIPVVRLLPIVAAPLLDELVRQGLVSAPKRLDRPAARERARVPASGPVADLVADQRA